MLNRILLVVFVLSGNLLFGQVRFNGGMEELDTKSSKPRGWSYSFVKAQETSFPVTLDSTIKRSGNYSLRIERVDTNYAFGVADFAIPHTFSGRSVTLKGYLRTQDVTGGYAGLWMRVDGKTGPVGFNNMANRGVTGTTDWKEYSITFPYHEQVAERIHVGALLTGDGKMWLDDLRLFIDGTPVDNAKLKVRKIYKADLDSAFAGDSGIDTIPVNAAVLKNLTRLGAVWGLVKYYHPEVAKGNFNMDAELFRVLPEIIGASTALQANQVLARWLDRFGPVPACNNCGPGDDQQIKFKPDYSLALDGAEENSPLGTKLLALINSGSRDEHYYIALFPGVGAPEFRNERPYRAMAYPDPGYRLLSLFRYWNMIQYFFPYKHLMDREWNAVLPEFLPKFIQAADRTAYTVTTLELIGRIQDTHANIRNNSALVAFKGNKLLPVQAKFIENKLVVTGYFLDDAALKEQMKVGDVITHIDGRTVEELIQKYLPLTPGSNYETQLRDLPGNYLLRGKDKQMVLTLEGRNGSYAVGLMPKPFDQLNLSINYDPDPKAPGYYLLNDSVGYIFPAKYKNKDLPAIKKLFRDTRGIIVDMRCYPSDFMPFTFGNYIKAASSPFAKFTNGSVSRPGHFTFTPEVVTGGKDKETYSGKVVVIVNSSTQSQAEYTTMAFQSAPNVTVIGSTTAGADGNVTEIVLPGGIVSMISGIGVYYPDGTETQRTGVKIDVRVEPTIQGIREGRDELLEKAMLLLR